MNFTPYDIINSALPDVVAFFKSVFSLFPSTLVGMLFFCPALFLVFEVVRYFRDAFKG